MYKDENLKWRKAVACMVDMLYCERGNIRFCHKRAHARIGRYICGVGYDSYMSYIKSGRCILEYAPLPPYVTEALAVMVRLSKLPAGTRYSVRIEPAERISGMPSGLYCGSAAGARYGDASAAFVPESAAACFSPVDAVLAAVGAVGSGLCPKAGAEPSGDMAEECGEERMAEEAVVP